MTLSPSETEELIPPARGRGTGVWEGRRRNSLVSGSLQDTLGQFLALSYLKGKRFFSFLKIKCSPTKGEKVF